MEIKDKKDILRLIGERENAEVEFKSAKGGFPKSFWETFSAFANTNGGVIVLGVKEDEGRFITDGLDTKKANEYKKLFWDTAHNNSKVSATMLTEKDVFESEIGEGKVLVFSIPRAPFEIRPVYLNKNPFDNTYKRNHEGDYHCTETEVRQMISDAQLTSAPYDNRILPNFTMDDIDMPSLNGYRQRFALRKGNHPWNDLDDLGFLLKIGARRVDRETGKEGFTRAGILMFGKSDSITDQSCAPWYFVDYQEKLSDDTRKRWSDRIYPDGTWEANLYQYFFRTYNKLVQFFPVPFELEGATRREETSAHIAMREALVNTLVHCDYSAQGTILVKREKETITFRNPGCMLVSAEDFYSGGKSICRNPILQKFFVNIGYGERAGSGADYILRGCRDNGWSYPEIREDVQPDMVTMIFSLKKTGENGSIWRPLSRDGGNSGIDWFYSDFNWPIYGSSDIKLSPVGSWSVPSKPVVCPKLRSSDEKRAKDVLTVLSSGSLPVSVIMNMVGERNRNRFRQRVLNPLMEAGLVERTIKDKPTSSKQAYRLTNKALNPSGKTK